MIKRWARLCGAMGILLVLALAAPAAAAPNPPRGAGDPTLGKLLRQRQAPGADHMAQAVTAASQGVFPEALREVEAALQADPKNAEAHRLRAALLLRLGQAAAAVEATRAVVELRPDDAMARYELGHALQ